MGQRVAKKWLGKSAKVHWLDATGYIGSSLHEALPFPCTTIGWIKSIQPDYIVIATSLYNDDSGDFTVIPNWIAKIEEV